MKFGGPTYDVKDVHERESSFAYPSKAQFYYWRAQLTGFARGGMSVDVDPCEHRDRKVRSSGVGQGGGEIVVSQIDIPVATPRGVNPDSIIVPSRTPFPR